MKINYILCIIHTVSCSKGLYSKREIKADVAMPNRILPSGGTLCIMNRAGSVTQYHFFSDGIKRILDYHCQKRISLLYVASMVNLSLNCSFFDQLYIFQVQRK